MYYVLRVLELIIEYKGIDQDISIHEVPGKTA